MRGSAQATTGKSALHVVSAYASGNWFAWDSELWIKSNEITAIPELLKVLSINNSMVIIDTMGCQTAIAQKIKEAGADYVLALKTINQN